MTTSKDRETSKLFNQIRTSATLNNHPGFQSKRMEHSFSAQFNEEPNEL